MAKKCEVYRDKIAMRDEPFVLRMVVGLLIPFIMLYGIYVLFNGHLSPGGGFSGGTILGGGLVLYSIAYGKDKVSKIFTYKTFGVLCSISLGFYLIAKGYTFMMTATDNSTGIPLGTPGNILSGGLIFPLSISVGIVVACTIYCFYALFSDGEV
jgi:multicomponent Na+:H+ antiporter subunit B